MSFATDLAKRAVEESVRGGNVAEVLDEIPTELRGRAGVFVSLKVQGRLRGCIGTIEPTQPSAAAEIIRSAILAANEDPRFMPVTEAELTDLVYSVDVLGEPEDVSGLDELDPRKYGCIVEVGHRRGLLLPDIEGVDSVVQQIEICRQKAGIRPDEPINLYRFTVTRYA
jgi:AmmeMemoRadiSam system protein A